MAIVNRLRMRVNLACLALGCGTLGAAVGCGSEPTAPAQQPVVPTIGPAARVVINPGDTTIEVGADVPLRVFVFDGAGHPIPSPAIAATTDKPDVASITAPATVSTNLIGKATITVSVGDVRRPCHTVYRISSCCVLADRKATMRRQRRRRDRRHGVRRRFDASRVSLYGRLAALRISVEGSSSRTLSA
jgi:hypothetical protein